MIFPLYNISFSSSYSLILRYFYSAGIYFKNTVSSPRNKHSQKNKKCMLNLNTVYKPMQCTMMENYNTTCFSF